MDEHATTPTSNEDQSECVIIERYRDSEAALEHAANLADLTTRCSHRSGAKPRETSAGTRSQPPACFLTE